MKNILSVIVLTLAFFFTSVNQTQADRLGENKSKKNKKEFQVRGFVFQPVVGITFAVVDDGQKYNVFHTGGEVNILPGKEGVDVSFTTADGKKGVIRISEVKLSDKRNKVICEKVSEDTMNKFRERFPEE